MTEKFKELVKTIEQNHWPVYGLEIRKNGELLHAYGDTKATRYPIYANCPAGHFYGASGMELTVEELGRLGQLYLNGGIWNGERILTEEWVKEATSVKTTCREGGYGYFVWKYKDGFRITGKWGKRCFVFPKTGITVTYLSDMQNNSEDLTEAVMGCIEV